MITAVNNAPPSAGSQAPASAKKSLGKDDFMKLLVTQLQAQDPLKPMDSQDFGAQLAQFSSLEQMTNVNTNLTKLQDLQSALSASSSVNLIGKKVDGQGNTVALKSGAPQTLGYSLANDASSVAITILDATGNKVNTLSVGGQAAGVNSLMWNGKDMNGSSLPDGNYTFNVMAIDAKGNTVAATTYSSGVVTDVVFESGVAKAIVNGSKVLVSQISRVS